MKSLINLSFLSVLFLIFSCNNAPQGEDAQTGEAQTGAKAANIEGAKAFQIDTQASKITWTGTKLIGGGHNGSIDLSSGTIYAREGEIVGGKFTIDMNTILDLDLVDLADKTEIEDHLKSEDFFNVGAFPTATFEITETVPASENKNGRQTITGNLTIKGIAQSITFFAKVTSSETAVFASTGSFVIDRTKWDVKHRSGAIGTAQDMVINDLMAIDITLVAKAN